MLLVDIICVSTSAAIVVSQSTSFTDAYSEPCQTSKMERFANSKQLPADLVTFTEEILNGKVHLLSSVTIYEKDSIIDV